VIFWEASALVPLLVEEPASPSARELLERDQAILVWWGTSLDCLSALARREREGVLTPGGADAARERLKALADAWSEVLPTEAVREHAGRFLRVHGLRAADALQLAAAMTWARGRPSGHTLATLDRRVWSAARAEGFVLEPAQA
jgi:hypothetical protein